MPDRIESSRHVKEDCSDLISDVEDLHPLLGKQKQHVQGRVTWSESKVMVRNQAIREEGFEVGSDDGFHDWSVVAGICFCTFSCRAVMFSDFQAVGR